MYQRCLHYHFENGNHMQRRNPERGQKNRTMLALIGYAACNGDVCYLSCAILAPESDKVGGLFVSALHGGVCFFTVSLIHPGYCSVWYFFRKIGWKENVGSFVSTSFVTSQNFCGAWIVNNVATLIKRRRAVNKFEFGVTQYCTHVHACMHVQASLVLHNLLHIDVNAIIVWQLVEHVCMQLQRGVDTRSTRYVMVWQRLNTSRITN